MIDRHCGCWTSQPAWFEPPFCLFSTLNQNQPPSGHEFPTETSGTHWVPGGPGAPGVHRRPRRSARSAPRRLRFPLGPIRDPGSSLTMWVNKFVENGGRLCRTLARSVRFGQCGPKHPIFLKIFYFHREVTLGSLSPQKPHIHTGIRSKMAWESQQPSSGAFGVDHIRLLGANGSSVSKEVRGPVGSCLVVPHTKPPP